MKRDETRFTIRFNPADPRHQSAMDALEASGRRKASLIADAICEYLARHGGGGAAPLYTAPLPVDAGQVCSISNGGAGAPGAQMPRALDDAPFDDMREAVLGGLSAFKI